jgi:hypothetical protein
LQADQRQALIELEAAVRSVQAVELQAESRLKAAAEAERRNRTREADLVQFRLRLDAWQANLTAHEKAATAAREAATAELAARRAHLERWEAALTTLCHKWAALRKQEREQLVREFHQWKTARTNYADGVRALDRARADFLAQAAAAAQTQLAAEQVAADLAGGGRKAARRLAVLRRKWEGHFRRFQSELDERRRCLVQETVSANDRLEQFQQRLAEIMARTTELLAAQQQAELQHLTHQREEDERASTLPGVLARAERSEAALAEVRAEVERVAAAVMASGPEVPTQRSLPSGEYVALARAA